MSFLVSKFKPTLMALSVFGLLGFSISLMIAGCNDFPAPEVIEGEEPHNLMSRLERETKHIQDQRTRETGSPEINIEQLLTEFEYVLVQPQNETPSDDRPQFHTLARKNKIIQYPCSNCHTEPIETLQTPANTAAQKNANVRQQAHWDIRLNHADEAVMNCLTCHTAANVDILHTLTGEPVDFDHSYQLCAQCHGQQFDDWQGGAHGKQVGGWAPPRVVHNCTDCHNPHQPSWDMRWPAVTNVDKEE